MKNLLGSTLVLGGLASVAAILTPDAAMALSFNIDRSWSSDNGSVSLVGTMEIPEGSYTMMSGSASPFTDIDLTLSGMVFTLDGKQESISVTLDDINTLRLIRSQQFLIEATASALTFDFGSDGGLIVLNSSTPSPSNFSYGLSTRRLRSSESASALGFLSVSSAVTLPVTFGVVPEPLTILGVGTAMAFGVGFKRQINKSKKK